VVDRMGQRNYVLDGVYVPLLKEAKF